MTDLSAVSIFNWCIALVKIADVYWRNKTIQGASESSTAACTMCGKQAQALSHTHARTHSW